MIQLLRRYVFHNFALKLVALLAAVMLWTAVARDPIAEVAVTVPVEFVRKPDNLEISSERIPEAQIRVRGPGRVVGSLTRSEVHAVIDLGDARPGQRTYDLTGRIHKPRDVEVVQVVPAQLQIDFDRRATREVPIRPRVVGSLAGGMHLTSVTSEPAEAEIVGPEKRVTALETAVTDPVDATGVVGRETYPGTHVYVSDPLVRVAKPATVRVTVVTGTAPERSRPAAIRK